MIPNMNLLKGTWLLKVLALLAALLTYYLIHHEMTNMQNAVSDPSYKLIKLTAEHLPVKVRLATAAPDGYRILADQVTSNPDRVIVIGPEALISEASSAETALVDVSESTKTFVKEFPLESVAGVHLGGKPYLVRVTVPIEKIEEKK